MATLNRKGFRILTIVFAAAAALSGCASADKAAPSLVNAAFLDAAGSEPIVLGVVTDLSLPLDSAYAETPTSGTIQLVFSELLDGDSVTIVVRDPRTGDVVDLVGRDGIVRVAPADGSLVDSAVLYDPAIDGIAVGLPPTLAPQTRPSVPAFERVTYLPAESPIVVNVLGDRVCDKAGNVMASATDPKTGEPIRDTDGRGIGGSVAFYTAPITAVGVELPDSYGAADDPDTPDVDESVLPTVLTFNTGIDVATAADFISMVPDPDSGAPTIPVTVAPRYFAQMVADYDAWLNLSAADRALHPFEARTLDPAVLEVTPLFAPQSGGIAYDLRIDPGFTDLYGVPAGGEPQIFTFTTLE
ncbi:MAG: hypothetical protein HY903_04085 [Deltaproteobacteria bacterium]|nr:hypothetical protein [Deltaproteobacteria bacterium]